MGKTEKDYYMGVDLAKGRSYSMTMLTIIEINEDGMKITTKNITKAPQPE